MKMYYQSILLLSGILLTSTGFVSAQDTKDEVEKNIERDEMPEASISMLNQFWNEEKKVDFYRQSDSKMISYEAKLDWDGYQYSIEFDSTGSLIDIEQLIEFDELTQTLRNTITEEIDKQYNRFRFTKVQRQFSASEENHNMKVLKDVLNKDFENLINRYEIEVDAQNKDELGSFELLFDENGNLIQKRKVLRRSLDNIW